MELKSFLGWVILGGLAGWLGSMFLGQRQGCVHNIIIGIAGALIGGFLFSRLGEPVSFGNINLWSLVVAVVGAVVLLLIIRTLRGPEE